MNLNNTTATISSREIAELTGKHHAHVMAGIRRTFAELGITDTGLTTYIDRQGKPRPCYQLTAEHAVLTFPSSCWHLSAALVNRLEELQVAEATALTVQEISTFADDFAAALEMRERLAVIAPLNSSALIAFSHELAPRLGVSHKRLKRDIEETMDDLGYDWSEQHYTFKDAKGREKDGYTLDMELLLSLITGCNVGHIVDDLMQPAEWVDEEEAIAEPH